LVEVVESGEILEKRIFLQYAESLRSIKTTEPIRSHFLRLFRLLHTEPISLLPPWPPLRRPPSSPAEAAFATVLDEDGRRLELRP
jgi:hypothetical protein